MPEVEFVVESGVAQHAKRNVEASFARNLPRFHDMQGLGGATGAVAIVAGGPSLCGQLAVLRGFPGVIMGCGTVHDYLITNGVIPHYHINGEPDADGVVLRWFQHPSPDVTYLLASHCPDDIFDALAAYDVRLWHLNVGGGGGAPDFRGEPSLPGGHFIVARAWPLAAVMGYRDIHFFGFDCSFPEDCVSQHAYGYEWSREDPVAVICGDQCFISTPGLLSQLKTFTQMLTTSGKQFTITIHGDGLVATVMKGKLCQP